MRREVGPMRNWCSGVVTAILAVVTGMWLAIPLIDSMRAGTRQQATVEAQAMTVFLTAGLVLLAVCRWIDDGRRVWRVGLLVCLVVVNSLVRVTTVSYTHLTLPTICSV